MYNDIKSQKRPAGRLVVVCFLAAIFFGQAIFPVPASAESGATKSNPDAENQKSNRISLAPRPDYGPQDVVRIQIEALANNNDPYQDAGIEITFRFASPQNKLMTGPLSRFIQMLYNPLYSPMLEHRSANFGELVQESNSAFLSVILMAADGQRVGYLFSLSKQKNGEFDQCWMTDSVLRYEVDAI